MASSGLTDRLRPLPRWIVQEGAIDAPSAAHAAFAAGGAVLALDQIMRSDAPWLGHLRMRLAIKAALAAARLLGLEASEVGLRDALHLTRAGDDPGPTGRLHLQLRDWSSRPIRQLEAAEAQIRTEAGGGRGEGELLALLAADRALAERLGWASVLPLQLAAIHDPALKRGSTGRRPRADEAAWPQMQHGVLLRAALAAHAEAVSLQRRAESLASAAARLRTRDEGRGLLLLLGDESVAPWRMVGPDGFGSDRAARRFCESLHANGALRLLTDRPAFRLYGV